MTATLEDRREAVIDVKISAFIPNDYIPQVSQKIAVYQQLAKARTEPEVDEIAAGVRDRFGPFPLPLENLIDLTKLRAVALQKNVTRVVVDDERLTLGVGPGVPLGPGGDSEVSITDQKPLPLCARAKFSVDLPPERDRRRAEGVVDAAACAGSWRRCSQAFPGFPGWTRPVERSSGPAREPADGTWGTRPALTTH